MDTSSQGTVDQQLVQWKALDLPAIAAEPEILAEAEAAEPEPLATTEASETETGSEEVE
jgi:hypothetical protein